MRKLNTALFFWLFLVSSSASAEWLQFGENDEGTVYFERESIEVDGKKRRAVKLIDLKQRAVTGVMSVKNKIEYDCDLNRSRILILSVHSGPMASGSTLYQNSTAEAWRKSIPGSMGEYELKVLCGK